MRVKGMLLASGAAAAMVAAAGSANADPVGWYGAIDAGWHTASAEAISDGASSGLYEFELDDGWAAFARLGYRFDQNWRVELEGGWRNNDISTVDRLDAPFNDICQPAPTGACGGPDGSFDVASLMVNVLYDFGDDSWGFRPFVGLGAGVARVNTDMVGTLSTVAGPRPVSFGADDASTELAAQALAGVAIALGSRGNLDLTYRYFMTDFEFESFTSGAPAPGAFEGEYDESHAVTIGLRWAFGAEPAPLPPALPPVAPPVAPPPVAPRPVPPPVAPQPQRPAPQTFVVYFEWDSTALSADANRVIDQAAAYAKQGNPTRILVVGHADTSGSAQYNEGLSARRARVVADALVADGVNSGVLQVDSRGEREPARQTGDGVREPLNRRATINVNF